MEPCTLGTARLANFRLGYTKHMQQIADARVRITLRGLDARTRIAGLTIRDVLNDAPNSCNLTIDGSESPQNEQALRIVLGRDHPHLLFNGALQTVDTSYEGWPPTQRVYPCTAIDDTARANRMRPFGTWVNVSATIYAQQLMARFAPGITTVHVQAGLPPVTITLDGTEGMSAALKQAATQIGGYFYIEDGDLHLFLEETTDTPDPIDGSPGRLLDEPKIRVSRDDSQLRTRQCGRAHGESLLADIAAGETILPVANVSAWFNTVGSEKRAIALSQRFTYAGVQDAGGGSLVGPGASPVVSPNVTAVAGAGLPNGVLRYAFSFVTAVGESLVGPIAVITAGPVTAPPIADPTTAPSGSAAAGAGLSVGTRLYAFTFTNGAGETLPGPSVAITTPPQATPSSAPTWSGGTVIGSLPGNGGNAPFNAWAWAVTFVGPGGETGYGPRIAIGNGLTQAVGFPMQNFPIGPAGTTARRIYRTSVAQGPDPTTAHNNALAGTLHFEGVINDNATTIYTGGMIPDSSLGASSPANATLAGLTNVGGIGIGPAGTTSRKVYRSVANGSALQLLTTLSNNSQTTLQDTTGDGSLGAAPPGSNTTAVTTNLNAATLTGIAQGPGTVTARRIYRTTANGSQLKLLQTIADNTTTTATTDTAADGALGANAPVSDTSGLVGVGAAGAVLPGATSLLTSGAGPFPAGGGWVLLSGNQLVRYTGITGNTLTGIPAAGVGSLVTTVLYGTQVLPAPSLTGVQGVTPIGSPQVALDVRALPGGGLGIGVWQYAITFSSAAGITLPSPPVTVTTSSGVSQVVIAPGVLPVGATFRNIYRTKNGGTQLYYLGTALLGFTDTTPDTSLVTPAPTVDTSGLKALVGPQVKGTPICVWVQRDDPGAQAEQAIVDAANGIVPADGIYEGPPLVDERRNETSMRLLCDATLALYARPIVTVNYDCRDIKSKSGRTIVIDLDDPPIHETLTIQEVTITEIDIAPGTLPRFSVVAASTRFSLDDIVRRLLTATDSVTSA